MAISEDTGNNNNPAKRDVEQSSHIGGNNIIGNNGIPPPVVHGGGGPNSLDMMDHPACGGGTGYNGRNSATGPPAPPSSGNKWGSQMNAGSPWDDSHNGVVLEPTYAPLVKVLDCDTYLKSTIFTLQ